MNSNSQFFNMAQHGFILPLIIKMSPGNGYTAGVFKSAKKANSFVVGDKLEMIVE